MNHGAHKNKTSKSVNPGDNWALKTCVLGKGIRETHDIKIHRGHNDTQIEFTRKDGKGIQPIDFFMLGYFVGRDY